MWSSLGIRQKVFALFSVIALLPLVVISIIWLRSTHDQLKQAAVNRQNILLSSSAQRLNDALETEINSVITHSQESSVTGLNIDQAKINLMQYANQDSDVLRITLVDNNGNEKIVINNHEFSTSLNNIKSSEEFKVVSQVSNEVSVSDVIYTNEQPRIIIAVPLLSFSKLGDQNLTSAEALARRFGSDVKGALIVDISLDNPFQSVLTSEIGGDGYTYIVDAEGQLIAHPDPELIKNNANLSSVNQVSRFLAAPASIEVPSVTLSEKNSEVLSSHYRIKRTGWAIIGQEPINSIYAPYNQVVRLAVFIIIFAGIVSTLLSLLFSRNLTRPIRSLMAGTYQVAQGNLDLQIAKESKDEIGVLAERFNTMTGNLKQMITNLKTEGTKLNVVLNSVGEGIVATDSLNHVVFANISAAVLAGQLPSDLTGKPFKQIFTLSKNNTPFQVDPNSTEITKEVVFISPNKRLHYLDIFVNKIENDPDGIKNIITLRDQTDERELEMMKLDFVSMAAHELRTPLTAIRGYLSLLKTDANSNFSNNGVQSIERAQSSTDQLAGLISNLLNVSKIERGSLNLSYSKLDWVKTVREALDGHKFSALEKQVTLLYEGPTESVPLLADEISIKEVINNLIANAIHYTPENGRIIISVREEGDKVITSIKDSGLGIPANALSRLFAKFYRVKGGMASGSGGTGLGLYISKSIVELHKGKIWVESEEGQGSTFTFSLPSYNEVQYDELVRTKDMGVNKRRGWITKNTAR
ncbi:HAMP domain-containing protein [Candidatus Saccharibacteria bacterium]|nr:HAMP domain-containing protein [Candidatus Saccharibacteria bacterium]